MKNRKSTNSGLMMFKILRDTVHIPTEPPTYFHFQHTKNQRTQHHSYLQELVNAYANSFFPDTIKLWNNLPRPPYRNCQHCQSGAIQHHSLYINTINFTYVIKKIVMYVRTYVTMYVRMYVAMYVLCINMTNYVHDN